MCGACLEGESSLRHAGPDDAATIESESTRRGRAFLARHPTVDIHAHPGRFMVEGGAETAVSRLSGGPATRAVVDRMTRSGIAAVAFALVSDHVLLELGPRGLQAARDFVPGEAFAEYERQRGILTGLVAAGAVRREMRGMAIDPPRSGEPPIAILSVEGGDFVEDQLERVAAAAAMGVRTITVVHYTTNQIGDSQTESVTHGGLTPLGARIVAEMEAHRILVDLSHASHDTSAAIAQHARRPLVLSHSNVRRPGQAHPRLVSLDHARLVTDTGGIVGAVPAGFDQETFDDYVDTIFHMVDCLGIDHVAIGTDMDYTYRPVMNCYSQWPVLAGALLDRGMREDEAAQVMGGNWLRVAEAA